VVPTVTATTNFNGVNFGESALVQANTIGGGATPPDPQGAVGPNSYIEAVNLTFAIYNPKTSNINPVTDAIDDFFNYQGNLPDPNPNDPSFSQSFSDPGVIFDEQTQRFIISCMEVDPGPQFGPNFGGDNESVFDFAVSKSSNPLTLTSADWNFYQVNTSEINKATGTYFFSDFPGNLGYNDGALVVTLNEFNPDTQVIDHVLVNAINMSDVTNGVPQAKLHVYQSDFQGLSLRPTTMHDSTSANDPMWFVQEHPGSGGLGDGQHIDVVKMSNVLSSTPTYTTTTLAVHPYTDSSLTPPLQPDGSVVTPDVDSRILKAAERNNLLVASQSVSVSSTQDDAQWYAIDLSSGTPALKQQGDVSGGSNTYVTYPGIDINSAGDIGMSYMQSGTDSPTDFLSMYLTGRTPTDPSGTMQTPVLAQAGQQVYQDFGPSAGSDQRAGDLSGINVDAQGNFWAINEFADNEPLPSPTAPSADWGTNITSFTFAPVADLTVTATGPAVVTPGKSASYTVTLTNNGPDAAQHVVLSDILPGGATNASITPVSNPDGFSFTLSNGVFTSNSVTVANGHQDQFTVTVTVPSSLTAGAVFDDSATVASTTTDPNPYDNAANVIGSTGQTITISTNYNAISYGQSATLLGGVGSTPPDNQGAVGPDSFIEAVNDAIGIYSPRTGTTSPVTDSLDDFFATQGGLPDPNPGDQFGNFITDPFVVFDEQTQRFIVGVMEVDPGPQFQAQSTGNNSSVLDLAVSKSSNPLTLKTTDWNFYQINTTETNEFSDYPGNVGYNGGALVVTLNEFNVNNTQNPDHVLVNAINMIDLTNGVPQASLRFYQSDFKGMSLRPTTMHDSTSANDPMWFVQEHLDAGGNPDNQHIDVVKMSNVLSSTPTYTTTTLSVNAYNQVVAPLQPDGSYVTPYLDSRIMKVAEQGDTLVAAQAVANAAGNQDLVQWYRIGVSSGTPALQDQGDVGAGPNTYLYFPGVDINPAGDIGISYIQSGTDNPNDFMSMYVTGRTPSDPNGTMEAPVLAQAGQQVYEDYGPAFAVTQRAGDLSGINVDSSGNFWAINEFADDEALPTTPDNPVADPNSPAADWGTNVVSFTLPASPLVFTQLTSPSATEGKSTGTFTVATFTDSNPNPKINNLTATVAWGDGSSDTLTAAIGGIVASGNGYAVLDSHIYTEEASGLSFSVQVVDSAGGKATDSATISVADATLAATGSTLTPPAGMTYNSLVASFTDADPNGTATDYSATISWGDGQSSAGTISANSQGGFNVSGSHTYTLAKTYTITVTITDAGGSSATANSTLTVSASASTATFLKTDTTTEGSWQGVYGSQGYNVIDNATSYPSYAQISPSGNSNFVWNSSTTDPRALQDVGSSNRIAACWYAGTSSGQGFTINVNLTDGQSHQLALYLLDWDRYGGGRSEQVQILDATSGTVLNTQSVSTFGSGEYLVWNVSGDIQIRITSTDSFGSAVLSGLFLDPAGSPPPPPAGKASFVKTDTTTEGSWQGVYGSQGYNVIDNASSYPSYAQISPSGNSNYVWSSSTTDPRALQDIGSSNRIAACWYAGTSSGQGFTINVNLTDGQTHQLALYLLDWDQYGGGRSEQVQLVDATSGTVLNTQSVSTFGSGEYLVWNVSGDIQIRITSTDSFGSAVLSGLFLDPVPSPPAPGAASFVKTDTTTEGNWQGVYGSQGYNVIDNATSYPSYAQISPSGNSNYVWSSSTTDPRALQDVGSSNRIAACWYAGTSSGQGFTINVNLTDGQTHQLALYLLDWDRYGGGRSEQVQLVDATSGTVLNTQSVSTFGSGEYLVWNVSGDIQIRITSTDSFGSAVLSGLFLDP
jgi:uncharacterized repeat protein (TIGR01451 family)